MHKPRLRRGAIPMINPESTYVSVLQSAMKVAKIPEISRLQGLLRSRSYKRLLEWSLTVSPQKYDDAELYFSACQLAALIKKVPFPKTLIPDLDPEAVATEKFLAAEERCRVYNSSNGGPSQSVLLHAKHFVRSVIGEFPDIPRVLSQCELSPGASVGVHGNKTNIARKILSDTWSVTPSALPFARYAWAKHAQLRRMFDENLTYDQFSNLFNQRTRQVSFNKISYVPKTAMTHRTIAVEPMLNSFLQKGVDSFIRARLKQRAQIDLSDQTRNQEMARLGSLPGSDPYCTIDLEAASDSLSIRIVKLLLPPEWHEFLSCLRSPSYRLGSESEDRTYHKYCSMGNGFCFPLESLIFSALTYGAILSKQSYWPDLSQKGSISSRVHDFSVYGDDIIVRSSVATQVVEALEDGGFTINSAKSFFSGPFRESCGADWYLGQDVRPVNLTAWVSNITQLFALHNSFLRSSVTEAWANQGLMSSIRKCVPLAYRYMRNGREPGDTCFSVPLDVAMTCPTFKFNTRKQCWTWMELSPRPIKDSICSDEERIAIPLNYVALNGGDPVRPFVLRYSSKRRKARVTRWNTEAYHGLSFSEVT